MSSLVAKEVKAEGNEAGGAGLSDGEIFSQEATDNAVVPEDATEPSAKMRKLEEPSAKLNEVEEPSAKLDEVEEPSAKLNEVEEPSSPMGQHTNNEVEIVKALVEISTGGCAAAGKIKLKKSIQFQNIISYLVTGSPILSEGKLQGVDELRHNHKVVVVWLSMISRDLFKKKKNCFKDMKSIAPCVEFKFIQLDLKEFMTLEKDPMDPSPPPSCPKPNWTYLLSLTNLKKYKYPMMSEHDHVSITKWLDCKVQDFPQVSFAKKGVADMPMFAIDCEMVKTKKDPTSNIKRELARISIVDEELKCVYNEFVKPDDPVDDYLTEYSGVSEFILQEVTTTLKDVQKALRNLLPENSILIGHSLNEDFKVMKFKHPFVIDTALLFPSPDTHQSLGTSPRKQRRDTTPNKLRLKKLAKELLGTDIQNTGKGHDPEEDATTCMRLVQLKLDDITPSIFTRFRTQGDTGIISENSVIQLFGKGVRFSAPVENDKEAVSISSEIIPKSKFTFIQLHDMELKEKESDKAFEDAIDTHVIEIVRGCPPKAIVFLVFPGKDDQKIGHGIGFITGTITAPALLVAT